MLFFLLILCNLHAIELSYVICSHEYDSQINKNVLFCKYTFYIFVMPGKKKMNRNEVVQNIQKWYIYFYKHS